MDNNQVLEITSKYKYGSWELRQIQRLIKAFDKNPSAMLAHQLEQWGFSIDVPDYGAEQNVERGQKDY